jgi:ABC-2 type transport system permease protein/sodium transport system permease protein
VRKEVVSILRDRRTIVTLVLMPLLLYPLLALAFQQFLLSNAAPPDRPAYRVGFSDDQDGQALARYVLRGQEALSRRPGARKLPDLLAFGFRDLEADVLARRVDVAVRALQPVPFSADERVPFDFRRDVALDVELYYREDNALGREAAAAVEEAVRAENAAYLGLHLGSKGVTQRPVPVAAVAKPLKDPAAEKASPLATLIPLVLILMTITGAVYPAIDLTAGERERGTLETLVAAPVPRLGLLFAKYVAVWTVAVLTALVNLGTMVATLLLTLPAPLRGQLFGSHGLTAAAVLEVFGLLLLFAAFFSAVLLALTSFARSFKEAQAYLVPLMLLSLAPGVLSLLPGMDLKGPWVVAPLLNVVLLTRDVFAGNASAVTGSVVVLTTLLYALAAVGVAARVFGAEAVLYNEQSGWADLVRRPARPQPAGTAAGALLCLALMFPLAFLLNAGLAWLALFLRGPLPPAAATVTGGVGAAALAGPAQGSDEVVVGLVAQGLATVLLFAGFPLAAAWLGRVRPASALRLAVPRWQAVAAALLLGVCLWPLVGELIQLERDLGVTSLRPEMLDQVKEGLRKWQALPAWPFVLAYAVLPAVLEELFFRGYLFSALLRAVRPATAVVVTAVVFGLFHLMAGNFLVVERLLPSTLLGLVLGVICWRTGSVVPGMVLHVCHNATLVLLAYYQPDLSEDQHLPWQWLVAAGAAAVLGAAWLRWGGTRRA